MVFFLVGVGDREESMFVFQMKIQVPENVSQANGSDPAEEEKSLWSMGHSSFLPFDPQE